MVIYHFVRYFDNISLDFLSGKNQSNAVLCFDLEDSIQDIFHPQRNPELKNYHRKLLQKILDPLVTRTPNLKTGVRINSCDTSEQIADLKCLSEIGKVNTIFLPKAENEVQIVTLIRNLDNLCIQYDEIIPVIETKTGMLNLENITRVESSRMKRIAFGHCDFNLDNNIFPFFHQDSREYWSWVEKIVSIIHPHDLKFVNSPFLELNNLQAFRQVLSGLEYVCGKECGQVVLTFNQALECSRYTGPAIPEFRKVKHRLQLNTSFHDAETFVKNFEADNESKPFAIIGENRVLLSPQEYNAANSRVMKKELREFNFTFVGGCFPIQGGINFKDRFHQLLKRNIENQHPINFNIQIMRYERLGDCLEKIIAHSENNLVDLLVFCIRPEPVLRLTKQFYRFRDKTGRIRKKLNYGRIKNSYAEMHDLLEFDNVPVTSDNNTGLIHRLLANLNYLCGIISGNNRAVMIQYAKLVSEVMEYCDTNQIPILVMGPAMRTHRYMEKIISRRLGTFVMKITGITDERYISGSDIEHDGKKLFHENGIHANERYHELIAGRMEDKLHLILKHRIVTKEASLESRSEYYQLS